jgi:two-component system OmpR family sensor kinase
VITSLRRSSLRTRLLLVTLMLTAAGMLVVNVIAVVALRSSLMSRVDQELMAIPTPAQRFSQQQPPGDLPVPDSSGSGFFSNLVVTTLDAETGDVVDQLAGPVVTSAPKPDLANISADIASGETSEPLQTVSAVDDSGYQYRVRVLPAATGSDAVVVVGKSLADVRSTVVKVAAVDAGVSVLVFIGLIVAGVAVIRVGLRPLTDVEKAASRLGDGELGVRAPHTDEAGEVGGLARTFNSMADSVENAFADRDASEQQLRQFIADASHELRTPLTTIRAYSELYSHDSDSLDPEVRLALQRIESESTRMSRLVEDLLVLARMDQQPELVPETVDLAAIVTDLAGDIATASRDHQVVTSIHGSARVAGSEGSLTQLASNLLNNAVVHTPAGTTVAVAVRQDGDDVVLTVSDDGPGMDPDDAERAFERFYRPQPGRERGAGTGLGLAIVEAVAAAHEGTVTLETSLGGGARFTVVLPAAKPADLFSKS